MNANDARMFATRCHLAKTRFQQTEDWNAYIADCIRLAGELALAAGGRAQAAKVVGWGGPAFRGAVDAIADQVRCPVDERYSANAFLSHLAECVASRAQEYYLEPLRAGLVQLGFLRQ